MSLVNDRKHSKKNLSPLNCLASCRAKTRGNILPKLLKNAFQAENSRNQRKLAIYVLTGSINFSFRSIMKIIDPAWPPVQRRLSTVRGFILSYIVVSTLSLWMKSSLINSHLGTEDFSVPARSLNILSKYLFYKF